MIFNQEIFQLIRRGRNEINRDIPSKRRKHERCVTNLQVISSNLITGEHNRGTVEYAMGIENLQNEGSKTNDGTILGPFSPPTGEATVTIHGRRYCWARKRPKVFYYPHRFGETLEILTVIRRQTREI